jgi:hypothetical protein
MAISTGDTRPVKLLIAARLSGADIPDITAAMQKSNKPVSMPLRRYENFLLQRFNTIQITKQNINTVDTNMLNEDINTALHIAKPYMLSVILDGTEAACNEGPSVNVVRSTITQTHKAKSMYSMNTNALLLDTVELTGFFVIV